MSGEGFWSRVKKARVVQVLIGYLAASWIVLQLVDTLSGTFELPPWIGPVTLILLVVGFVVVMATAWVQSHPLAERREGADRVPGSWELAAGEIKESLSRGEVPHLTWARAVMGGVFAFSLLFGLAGVYVLLKDRGESLAPTEAVADDDAAPAVAVLPFSVRGEELDVWREGMVDALSANLEGAGGLRTIASQTVLARLDELGTSDGRIDLSTQLAVARATGARYALTGSVISTGSNLRLSADVYDAASGEPLGHGRAEGAPDSMFVLVDRLSIAVLREMLSDEELRASAMSLAAVTTPSLEALKAYLEGEAHYRRGDFESAVPAYERAVEADSTFAMANYRLDNTYGWLTSTRNPLVAEASDRAVRYADQLPARQAVLVRASQALSLGTLDGLAPLREAVRRHPDDAEAWFQLGETYLHLGQRVPVSLDEAETAVARAVELAPRFVPYRLHWYDLAAWNHPDSAEAAGRLEALQELGGSYEDANQRAVAFELTFGDSATQRAAIASVDLGDAATRTSLTVAGLRHPRFVAQSVALRRRWLEAAPPEERPWVTGWLARGVALGRGRVTEGLELVSESGLPPAAQLCQAYSWYTAGLPVPRERVAALAAQVDPDDAPPCAVAAGGFNAVDTGDWSRHEAAIEELRSRADSIRSDSVRRPVPARREAAARPFEARGRALEGYGRWKRGDPQDAARILDEALSLGAPWIVRWWLGQIHLELDRPVQARRYFEAMYWDQASHAHYHLGKIYEELGDPERAREAYETFVIAWADADPELQPMVGEAKGAIVRLMDAPSADDRGDP